jgi:uncharacterized protein (DUF2384 family)
MASQTAATVETLLGVNANAGNTRLSLANSIMSGLPVSALDRLGQSHLMMPASSSGSFRRPRLNGGGSQRRSI